MKPTLEQLQEFTDAELSEAVLRKLHPELKVVNSAFSLAYDAKNSLRGHGFDINNWSDMGALANKHGIGAKYSEIIDVWESSTLMGKSVFDKNELRAKAIVFLLMEI